MPNLTDAELNALVHTGLPNSGMPANLLNDQETRVLAFELDIPEGAVDKSAEAFSGCSVAITSLQLFMSAMKSVLEGAGDGVNPVPLAGLFPRQNPRRRF